MSGRTTKEKLTARIRSAREKQAVAAEVLYIQWPFINLESSGTRWVVGCGGVYLK